MLKLTITVNGKTVEQDFTDTCVKCLEHDLLDIPAWIINAVVGKISKCSERMARDGMELIKADPTVTSIPVKQDELIATIASRSDYKNRAAREAAAKQLKLDDITTVTNQDTAV